MFCEKVFSPHPKQPKPTPNCRSYNKRSYSCNYRSDYTCVVVGTHIQTAHRHKFFSRVGDSIVAVNKGSGNCCRCLSASGDSDLPYEAVTSTTKHQPNAAFHKRLKLLCFSNDFPFPYLSFSCSSYCGGEAWVRRGMQRSRGSAWEI